MDTKKDMYICCLQETHFRTRNTYRLKVRGWKKVFHANGNQKIAGVAIPISDKIDFKIKAIRRDKEGHYIMIKGSIQEEDIIIVNVYAPNIGAHQYIRQMLTAIKGEMHSNTINVGDFNTPRTPMDISCKMKMKKEKSGRLLYGRRAGRSCCCRRPGFRKTRYIRNTSTCGTAPTEHPLNAGRKRQTSQKPCG